MPTCKGWHIWRKRVLMNQIELHQIEWKIRTSGKRFSQYVGAIFWKWSIVKDISINRWIRARQTICFYVARLTLKRLYNKVWTIKQAHVDVMRIGTLSSITPSKNVSKSQSSLSRMRWLRVRRTSLASYQFYCNKLALILETNMTGTVIEITVNEWVIGVEKIINM